MKQGTDIFIITEVLGPPGAIIFIIAVPIYVRYQIKNLEKRNYFEYHNIEDVLPDQIFGRRNIIFSPLEQQCFRRILGLVNRTF